MKCSNKNPRNGISNKVFYWLRDQFSRHSTIFGMSDRQNFSNARQCDLSKRLSGIQYSLQRYKAGRTCSRKLLSTLKMDVMQTPPHCTNHIAYFGEEAFLRAPKKPREYCKLRSGRKLSARSLDFSAIVLQGEDDGNPTFSGNYERRQSQLRRNSSRNETPVFVRNVNSPVHHSPLAFENTIARRIDFGSQSFTPGQETTAETSRSPSVLSPGLSPTARGLLSQLKRSSSKTNSAEKRTVSRRSVLNTPESCSPEKRPKWTRILR